jgi:hypothetical protein
MRAARKPSAVARELLRNFPKSGSRRRRRKRKGGGSGSGNSKGGAKAGAKRGANKNGGEPDQNGAVDDPGDTAEAEAASDSEDD